MKKTHLRRSLAALATAIACVAIMGNPAAASATYTAVINSGVITLTKTGMTPEVVDLAPTTPSCTNPSTLTVTTTSTTSSSTVSVTAINASHIRTFGATGTYLTVLTRSASGNVAGHIDSTTTPHTVTGSRVSIVITVYNTTSCTPTGTPICTLAVSLNLNGFTTSISDDSSFTLTGSSQGTVVAFPTCAAGPSYLIGSASTATSPITGDLN